MHHFQKEQIVTFENNLYILERSPATIQKYIRIVERFYDWLPEDKMVDKGTVISYKVQLAETHVPSGVNTILAALCSFFRFMGWQDCIVKSLRIQRKVFSQPEAELNKQDYLALVRAACAKQDERLSLILQLIASTGIRVSEIRFLTVEALGKNRVEIRMKGKIRTILLPGKLCHKLRKYQRQQKIRTGSLFVNHNGVPLNRRTIWAQMKQLCEAANVPKEKVFPHNLRHLFARTFFDMYKDIAKLADLLGHTSIETTRIYLISSGYEHQKSIDRLYSLYG